MDLKDFVYLSDIDIRVPGYTYFINKYGYYLDWNHDGEEYYLVNLNGYLHTGEKIIFKNHKLGHSAVEIATGLIKFVYKIHK